MTNITVEMLKSDEFNSKSFINEIFTNINFWQSEDETEKISKLLAQLKAIENETVDSIDLQINQLVDSIPRLHTSIGSIPAQYFFRSCQG
jgi:hypothetical protein